MLTNTRNKIHVPYQYYLIESLTYMFAILAEIYYCGFWHCFNKKQRYDKESKSWGTYDNINGDCNTCQQKCTRDPNCKAINCDYWDSRNCVWWNSRECEEDERPYSEKYKTCAAPKRGHIFLNYSNTTPCNILVLQNKSLQF